MQFKYVFQSLILNYKSWIVLFLVLIAINCYRIYDFITLFIMLITVHLFHYLSHYPIFYPLNCAHLYHHDNNNLFSHFIQIIIEFVSILSPIIIKYIFFINSNFFNTYLIIFIYLFYTSIHTINYSLLHVNNVHEYHHINKLKNAGPDICDILFNTKHNVENEIENTDHYIPNIIMSMIFIFIFKYIYTYILNKNENTVFSCFFIIMFFLTLFLIVSSIFIFIGDINKFLNKKLDDFAIAL